MSCSAANFKSLSDLPTPENTIFLASAPAFKARFNSPTDTTSKPIPKLARTLSKFIFPLALTE